jgi:hypothetical protein
MVMFTAYFDASGHPNDVGSTPALFVSGFVSTVEKWLKFEKYWLALLEEFHITPPFHMTDFESGHGQYAAWKDDREERERFRSEALHVIKRWTNKPFSSGVLIPDFQRLFREYAMPPEVPREPYPFCGEAVVVDLLRPWLEHCIKDGRFRMGTDNLQIVFEHGDKHKGLLEAALERRNVDAIFMKKAALVPFQACDFLAWMHRRWLRILPGWAARTDRRSRFWSSPKCSRATPARSAIGKNSCVSARSGGSRSGSPPHDATVSVFAWLSGASSACASVRRLSARRGYAA